MLIKRVSTNMSSDLRTSYRPCRIDELLGNDRVKKILQQRLDKGTLTHTMLFTGPSSTGKTTTARIIALSLNCVEAESPSKPCLECANCRAILNQNCVDIQEINVGSESGKAEIAAIVNDVALAPFQLRNKVFIFDEAHKLTVAAKDLLLKVMEDTYEHVYFIFCTDEPEKLKNNKKKEDPFLNRCDQYKFEPLSDQEVFEMLENVSQFEGVPYTKDVLQAITEYAAGIPRKALGALGLVISEGSWSVEKAKVLFIQDDTVDAPELIELCRALSKGRFKDSVKLFELATRKYEVELIRITVCGYFASCLKNAKNVGMGIKFSAILDLLTEPIYVTGKSANYIFYNHIFKITRIMMGS